jgi:hypothetical protein
VRTPAILRSRIAIAIGALVIASCSAPGSPSPERSAGPSGSTGAPSVSAAAPTASAIASSNVTPPSTTPAPVSADAIAAVPELEGVFSSVAVDGGTIVAGGFAGPGFAPAILVFADGEWSVAKVPDATGQVAGIVRLADRWIAVGNGLPDTRVGFIWDSPDGREWRSVRTIDDAALYDIATGAGTVVAVGALLDAEMTATAAAWWSMDGSTWQRAKVAGAARTPMGPVAYTSSGYAAAGDRPLGQPRPFWSATEPSSWASVRNDLNDQSLPADLVGWRNGLALVGASGKSGDQHPFVALSPEGEAWERTLLSDEEGYASAVVVAKGRLLVAGVDADRLVLWSLETGSWTATTLAAGGASISALAWDPDLGLIGVGARDGSIAAWLLTIG